MSQIAKNITNSKNQTDRTRTSAKYAFSTDDDASWFQIGLSAWQCGHHGAENRTKCMPSSACINALKLSSFCSEIMNSSSESLVQKHQHLVTMLISHTLLLFLAVQHRHLLQESLSIHLSVCLSYSWSMPKSSRYRNYDSHKKWNDVSSFLGPNFTILNLELNRGTALSTARIWPIRHIFSALTLLVGHLFRKNLFPIGPIMCFAVRHQCPLPLCQTAATLPS